MGNLSNIAVKIVTPVQYQKVQAFQVKLETVTSFGVDPSYKGAHQD
jgi:hypothetical protein